MTAKFKVGQWISKEDVLKLGKVRWDRFREKYKSEHTTTRDFTSCGLFEDYQRYRGVFVYKDGDLAWDDSIGADDKQITYETILEYIGEKEMNKFDLKTQPWWIRVNNEEESKATQEWLFEQGMTWCDGGTHIGKTCFKYLTNYNTDGDFPAGFMWMTLPNEYCHTPDKEIKLSFETITKITNVIFPEADGLVELNGKKYKKSDLEAALSKLNPVEE